MSRKLEGNLRHVLTEQSDPSRPIGLFQITAGRQRRAAIEHADVVQAEEATLKQTAPEAVLAVDPPAEIRGELAEDAL